MNDTRKEYETAILERYFPKRYVFASIKNQSVLQVGIKSQSAKVYQLCVVLPVDYPNAMPDVFIVFPKALKDCNGKSIKAFSHEFHTLECNKEKVQICHFLPSNWNPQKSLYLVIMKVKIWIESYEGHLSTGKPISAFLKT
jgi:hypothetical protein